MGWSFRLCFSIRSSAGTPASGGGRKSCATWRRPFAERKHARYLDALRELSRRVAAIELVPYHSSSFRNHSLIEHLATAQHAIQYARTSLLAKASSGKCSIIITRTVEAWGLRRVRNGRVVLYKPALARLCGGERGILTLGTTLRQLAPSDLRVPLR